MASPAISTGSWKRGDKVAPFTSEKDKTEEPTPHRLREARRKGQVFRSVELVSAANLLTVLLALLLLGSWMLKEFEALFSTIYGHLGTVQRGGFQAGEILLRGAGGYLTIMAPFFGTAVVAGVAINLLQVGFNASGSRLSPQLERINPLQGLKRIFSQRALFELAKAIMKLVIVGMVTFYYVRGRLPEALALLNREAVHSAALIWKVMGGLGLRVGLLYLALALLDYLFQRREHWKSLRMTRREVKEELKHLEGDPLIRSRIRERQRLLAQQRMLEELPTADLVITNPTAIAVALRYRAETDQAPRVVAMGAGVLARKIRELAQEHRIALVENRAVAQLLWKNAAVGEEIPVELYQAVAEILALVYRMKEQKRGGGGGAGL